MAVVSDRFDALGQDHPEREYRLGILGGTFDPIHDGHLACAEQAREAFDLDAVLFIPTAQPVFKRGQRIVSARRRLEMCRMATQDNPYFDVSSLEIDRGGDTYTIDTLRVLRAHFPQNVSLYFICGGDTIATISKWRESANMGALARFVGVDRPGFEFSDEQRRAIRESAPTLDISFVTIEALAISSSELRHRIESGKSIRYLTPSVVRSYIIENGLYYGQEEHDEQI